MLESTEKPYSSVTGGWECCQCLKKGRKTSPLNVKNAANMIIKYLKFY